MFYVLSLGILYAIASAIGFSFKRRIEETIAISIMSIMFFLYISGLVFNSLIPGFYIVLVFAMLCLFYSAFQIIQKRQEILSLLLTPGLFISIVIFSWMIIINSGRQIAVWDEFSHWALTVKNMCIFDYFGFIEDANTTYKTYPPAISLWEYFMCKLSGGYSDTAFYNAFSFFSLSLLLPYTKNFKLNVKGIILSILTSIILISTPMIFGLTYMVVGYVDVTLGLLTSYILFEHFTTKTFDAYHYAMLFLSIGTLSLVKGSGLTFCIVLILLFASDLVAQIRANNGGYMPYLYCIYSGILGAFLSRVSWNLLLKNKQVPETWHTNEITIPHLIKLIKGNGPLHWYKVTSNFFDTTFTESYGLQNPIPYIGWLLGIFIILIVCSLKLNFHKRMFRYSIILLLGDIVYSLGLLLSYIFVFTEYEGLTLASYKRYMLSYLLIFLVGCGGILLSELNAISKKGLRFAIPVILIVLQALMIPVEEYTYLTFEYKKDWAEEAEYRNIYSSIKNYEHLLDYKKDKVAIIAQEDDGRAYYVLKFEIAPVKIFDFWSIGAPYSRIDFYSIDMTGQEWLNYLILNDCNYVYIQDINDYFADNIIDVFENRDDMHERVMFSIENDGEEYFLRKVELQ